MATYLKRTSKLFDLTLSQASFEMNLRDLMCPVCRGILIEPVTLPCTHNLCLRCLKGTFEHNSLSCPLCRVRVGSWLRTATKSESLVNGALWQHIRSTFPKEIQNKSSDDVTDINSDADYAPKIISAAGEIRREYEKQLQIAEAEMRRQRETERIANEELIRKIHEEEEKQKYQQLAQDQLLARNLAKKQLLEKEKSVKTSCGSTKNSGKYLQPTGELSTTLDDVKTEINSRHDDVLEPRTCNLNALFKIQSDRLDWTVKPSILAKSKDVKACCDHLTTVHNTVTLKQQPVTMSMHKTSFNYNTEPSCSNSKIYGDQSEEELRVPSDVLNSNNKKSLGVEICVTTVDDKRIGSAQSAGSHDSINPEIHHFKPIRAIGRTPLKVASDGRQIDPKLIRVIPFVRKISNPIVRPPAAHLKRIVGCSWSAFKGRARQDLCLPESEADWKPPINPIQGHQHSKLNRPTATETARKLDLVPDSSYDSNKNYAKSINRLINSTKVSKKLILDDEISCSSSTTKATVKSKAQLKNGTNSNKHRKQNKLLNNLNNTDESSSSPLINPVALSTKSASEIHNNDVDNGFAAMENIAERIKRRKVNSTENSDKLKNKIVIQSPKKSTRSRATKRKADNFVNIEEEEESPVKLMRKEKNTKRTTRNSAKAKTNNEELNGNEEVVVNKNDDDDKLNERVIEGQEKMERLLAQERKDFELAQKLQAQFNEMERISGRTRGSKRALEYGDDGKSKINGKILSTMSKSRRRKN